MRGVGVPEDTRVFIDRLQDQIEDFYRRYPRIDAFYLPREGIQRYTRMAGPVMARLRKGDVALARFLAYELPEERNLFFDMMDKMLLCAAEALCGAYGTGKEERRALDVTYDYMEDLSDEDRCEYPLLDRWMEHEMSKNYRLQKKWYGALRINYYYRLSLERYYPDYLPEKRRIPAESQRRIRRLQKAIRGLYRSCPAPEAKGLPDDEFAAYMAVTRPVVRYLRDGDLGVAQYIVYGLPEEGDLLSAVGDFPMAVSALALVGAYSGGKEREQIEGRIRESLPRISSPMESPFRRRCEGMGLHDQWSLRMLAVRDNLCHRFGLDVDMEVEK